MLILGKAEEHRLLTIEQPQNERRRQYHEEKNAQLFAGNGNAANHAAALGHGSKSTPNCYDCRRIY
jgi:hypothetical protein